MDAYIQTAIGIVVSILLFLLGYRQTIGARKERIRAANKAVQRALLRRLVLEDYQPQLKDMSRLIEGKSQDFLVSPADLFAEPQILSQIYSEIFDNDFIPAEKRDEIEHRLQQVFDELLGTKQPPDESLAVERKLRIVRDRMVASLAVVASLMGATTVMVYTITRAKALTGGAAPTWEALLPFVAVFVGSLAAVVAIAFIKRAREAPEDLVSRRTTASDAADFENEVASLLVRFGVPFKIQPDIGPARPDFVADLNGRQVAIEVKAWRDPPPVHYLARVIEFAQTMLQSNQVQEVLVVTRTRSSISFAEEKIRFVTLKELREIVGRQR